MIRIGQGWDIHRLTEGRPLILGGIEIPFEKGLDGHSDADVLLHALTDALLGAAGLGDIGEYFPPSDPQWKGADSGRLLRRVLNDVRTAGWNIVNADLTIIAERPRLKDWKPLIRKNTAELLGVPEDAVNIKAKTKEKVDATGEGRAMEALAAVLLEKN